MRIPPAKDGKGAHLVLDTSESTAFTRDRSSHALGETHLAADDIEELRTAIERSLCEGEINDSSQLVVDDELRKSLRVACAKARLQRVLAEHVLMDVKKIWMSIPAVLTTHTSERLSGIVTTCIDEYYGNNGGTSASPRA